MKESYYESDKASKKTSKKKGEPQKAPFGSDLNFEATEAYNLLRTNLTLSMPSKEGGRIIGLTSSAPHEGKSYTSVNLAFALAKNGSRTVLVSGDMRKPTLEMYFNVEVTPGLSEVLSGQTDFSSVIRSLPTHENLFMIPAGKNPPNPSELISSKDMKKLLDELCRQFEYVIIDLPPVSEVVDPIAICPLLDGMIVVVNHGYTHRRLLVQSMKQLRFSGVHILGFVYNGYHKHGNGYSHRY